MRRLDRSGQYVDRPPVQCLGLVQEAPTPADHREVVQRRGDFRMLGTEQPFFDSKRLPVEPLGLLEVAVPPGDPRKVEEFISVGSRSPAG